MKFCFWELKYKTLLHLPHLIILITAKSPSSSTSNSTAPVKKKSHNVAKKSTASGSNMQPRQASGGSTLTNPATNSVAVSAERNPQRGMFEHVWVLVCAQIVFFFIVPVLKIARL